MTKTLVIAEPGCTHEGSRDALVRLLETAHACGASCFKPQWTSDPAQMCERRHITRDHPKRAYYERAYGWLAFPREWHSDFAARCKVLGMQYACTAFLPQDVAILDPFVDAHKVASFEAQDDGMRLAHVAVGHHKEVWMSTGMQGGDVPRTLLYLKWQPASVMLFHCVSAYPAPLPSLNLAAIQSCSDEGPEFDGFSDHSRNLIVGAVAVAAGAARIETHYRLDDCSPDNPDYGVSFTPAEFTTYIDYVRQAEVMLGDGVKRVQDCEAWALPYRVTG